VNRARALLTERSGGSPALSFNRERSRTLTSRRSAGEPQWTERRRPCPCPCPLELVRPCAWSQIHTAPRRDRRPSRTTPTSKTRTIRKSTGRRSTVASRSTSKRAMILRADRPRMTRPGSMWQKHETGESRQRPWPQWQGRTVARDQTRWTRRWGRQGPVVGSCRRPARDPVRAARAASQ
jgi:hypothetical protein